MATPDFARAGDLDHKFLPGTRRLRRKGLFPGRGLSDRLRLKRIAISINLIRLCAMSMRSPARAIRIGVSPVRCVRSALPVMGPAPPSPRCGGRQRHDGISRQPRPVPSRVGISRLVTVEDRTCRPRWGRRPRRAEKHDSVLDAMLTPASVGSYKARLGKPIRVTRS
jgi:hypothetical protein